MTSPLRVGLIGTGWVAHQHARGYASVAPDRVVITAAADPREKVLEDFAQQYGIPHTFGSADALLDSGEVDAVVLLTPPAVRDEVIFPAIERGLQLLIEKPFAATAREAMRYTEAAERGGVTLAVSQNFRWFPEYRWLKARLGEPGTGDIRFLSATTLQNRPQAPGQWRAGERRLEMAIFSVHLIDRLQWIAGTAPLTVRALTRRDPESGLEGEQLSSLLIEFEGGAVATMTSNWMSRGLPRNDFRVDTSTGSAEVHRTNPMDGEAEARASFGAAGVEERRFADDASASHSIVSYGSSMAEFARAIAAGEPPEHSGRDNLKTMAIMDAAYLSADRGGARVEIAEVLT